MGNICLPEKEVKFWVNELRELFLELKMRCNHDLKRLEEIEVKFGINKQKARLRKNE